MDTQFIKKTITPTNFKMATPIEVWLYGLLNSFLVGGASAVVSSVGLATAHGIGVSDIPALNLHTIEVIFAGGALTKFFIYLAQGLPALKPDADQGGNPPLQGGQQ